MNPTLPPARFPDLDPDPVETAAAVAITMRRLVAETGALAGLDQAPQITDELLAVLREIANVTTLLSTLAFRHPTTDPPTGNGLDAVEGAWAKAQAVDAFTEATRRVYVACKPLAAARNATRLLPTPDLDHEAPVDDAPGHPGTDRTRHPDPPYPDPHGAPARPQEELRAPAL
jgi:hypothetical protein